MDAVGCPALAARRTDLAGARQLCALRLDYRLAGLADAVGAAYTRYADDLTISGPADFAVEQLRRTVLQICAEEGFALNPHKTRVMRQSGRLTSPTWW